jgi:hypothetical protein
MFMKQWEKELDLFPSKSIYVKELGFFQCKNRVCLSVRYPIR